VLGLSRPSFKRRLAATAGIGALLFACTAQAQAPLQPEPSQAAAPAGFSPDQEIVLALTAPRAVLSEALLAYDTLAGVFLPLGEIAQALDFAIALTPPTGASGWFIRESRGFELDVPGGRVVIEGRETALPPGLGGGHRRRNLRQGRRARGLVPLQHQGGPRRRRRCDHPDRAPSLPSPPGAAGEARRARRRWRRRRSRLPTRADALPSVHRAGDRPGPSSGRRVWLALGYDARLSGDLAYMAANVFVGGEAEEPLSNLRVDLGRVDPEGFGPLGLTEFAIGDVFSPDLPNGVRTAGGRGIHLTNAPSGGLLGDRVNVIGELPLGFEAELYRNGVLIDSQTTPRDGRYEFRDVPLTFGLNVVRVVLYGPRGETREEVRQYRAGGDAVPAGAFRFRLGAVEVDQPVFGVGDHADDDPLSLFDPAEKGELQFSFLGEYGLRRGLALSGHLGARPDADRTTWLTGLGLRADLRGAAVRVDGTVADDGSGALSGSVLTRIAGVNLALEHARYEGGFLDDRRSFDNEPLESFTGVRADSLLELGGREIPISLQVEERRQTDGDVERLATARTSTLVGRVLVSGGLRYDQTSGLGENEARFDGDLDFNAPVAEGLLRLGLNYELEPEAELQSVFAAYDRNFGERMALRLGLSQELADEESTRVLAALTRRFRTFDLSVDAEYDSADADVLVGLRLSTSLFWTGRGYRPTRPGFASSGSAAVRIYQDLDADGRRGPQEPGAAGVRVGGRGATTDADGVALVRDLAAGRTASVGIEVGSIEDPFQQPSRAGFGLLPRPGRTHSAEIGLVRTAEVETAVLFQGETERAVANVDLELVGPDGQVGAEARSEYDGFVLFEGARPGHYRIRLQPQQAERLGLELVEEPAIAITPGIDVVKGPALRVRRRAGATAERAETLVFRGATLRGATLLDARDLERVWGPYRGRTVTLSDLRTLATAFEAAYADAGHPFVAVVVPPQDVQAGQVEFEVVEGRISDLTILGRDPVARRQAQAAFGPLVDRRPLPLADVEAAYERAQDVPGLTVAGSLRRGGVPGGMDLVVQARRRTWRTYANLNNLYPTWWDPGARLWAWSTTAPRATATRPPCSSTPPSTRASRRSPAPATIAGSTPAEPACPPRP
jgi:hypothetical protein